MKSQQSQQQSESKKGLQSFQQTKATSPLDFYRERGSIVIENEHGWANYFIMGETGYLQNMYIYPTSRRSQNGTLMLSNIELAMSEIYGCKKIMTTISRLWGDAEKTLQISLKRGFKLASLTDDAIFLIKEL